MKIKKLAALCKKSKRVIIYEREIAGTEQVQQYISDGTGTYPVFGLPRLTKETVLTIFDVEQKDWNKWYVSVYADPEDILVRDTVDWELPLKRFYQPIIHNDRTVKSVQIDGQTVFFDNAYLAPVADAKDIMYYGRRTRLGTPVIAVKSGLLLQATIMPCNIAGGDWIEMMEEMLAGCRCGKQVTDDVD